MTFTSTYQADFPPHKIDLFSKKRSAVLFDPLDSVPEKKPAAQYDMETLSKFREGLNIPFSLLHRCKEIIHTNPNDRVQPIKLENKIFQGQLKSRKTRKRVYMVPQISLDDVPEDQMYGENGLVDYIYSSNWKCNSKFAIENSRPTNSSSGGDHDSKTITLDDENLVGQPEKSTKFKGTNGFVPLDPALKKYATDWEKCQLKQFVDTTEIFWKSHPELGGCRVCDPLIQATAIDAKENEKIQKCIKEDKLSSPYMLHSPSYTGYKPKVPYGVQVCNKRFKKCDPYVTTLMALQGVYEKP